jgi:ribonucleotide reductase alpha subunit
LSNCFVLPELHDSYGGILYADQQLIQLAKRRGGIGIDISNLRPDNMAVSNAAGSSTGAVSFMERFSSSCREVAQKGRRGALMLSIDIQHPDVEKFITIKQDLTKVTGANISVKVSDEFMKAVKDDKEYTHQWPVGSAKPSITKTIKARELWNTLVTQARNNAEPGILFWDRLHWYSTSSVYPQYKNISTNPCISGDALIEACEEDYQSYKVKIPMKELVGRIISGENISVLTYNEKTKETEYKDVEAGMLTKKDANIIELELEDGRTLKLTPEHKVFTENRGWIEASLLTEDDILLEI